MRNLSSAFPGLALAIALVSAGCGHGSATEHASATHLQTRSPSTVPLGTPTVARSHSPAGTTSVPLARRCAHHHRERDRRPPVRTGALVH
ncbi:MAG TPA: hypothetical protein VFE19_14085 [Jatrophihabitantaceae bacterium]|nr:hypothetical protein [Jatrophihabitantaceae bacterium]